MKSLYSKIKLLLFMLLVPAFCFTGCVINHEDPFTNVQGNESTVCAHDNCKNLISRSGDTLYCEEHSSKCKICGCYIDEGKEYCNRCISDIVDSQPMETSTIDIEVYTFQDSQEK